MKKEQKEHFRSCSVLCFAVVKVTHFFSKKKFKSVLIFQVLQVRDLALMETVRLFLYHLKLLTIE